jgi:hypothetical protein
VISEYIGKTVLLRVNRAFVEENENFFGFPTFGESGNVLVYSRLASVDEFGVYAENKNFQTIPTKTKIPETHKMNFLIPWQFIVTVAVFPDRKFEGNLKDDEISTIGFHK